MSTSRRTVFLGFREYRSSLNALDLNVTQWIDGSFVDRSRLNPSDIDLVNFTHADDLNKIPQIARKRASFLLKGGEATKPDFACHTFLVVEQPKGHPLEHLYGELCDYWSNWFATPQNYTGGDKIPAPERGRKGVVQMQVGDVALAPKP